MLYIFDKDEKLAAILKHDPLFQHGIFSEGEYFMSSGMEIEEGVVADVNFTIPFFTAVHTEKLDGSSTLTFTTLANLEASRYIKEENIAGFKDLDGNWQMFYIKRIEAEHKGSLVNTCYCEGLFNELLDEPIADVRPGECLAAFALAAILAGTRWEVGQVDELGPKTPYFYYENVLSGIEKIASLFAGEAQFRVLVQGNRISKRYVDLKARIGMETGKQFVFGKDIMEIKRTVNSLQIATALYGRGKSGAIDAENGLGVRLSFVDAVWVKANGDPVDKPQGQEWVGDPAALSLWGRDGRHRFDFFTDDAEEDPAVLLQKTWDALQQRKNPLVTYEMSVTALEQFSGYAHEKVRIGDTVRAIDTMFSPPLKASARIIEIERDLVNGAQSKVVLGNYITALTDPNSCLRQTLQKLTDKQGAWDKISTFGPGTIQTSWLDGEIDILRNQISSTRTHWYTDEDGNMIFENVADSSAMMLTGSGFMLASEKDQNNAWVWRAFGTGIGFTADEINTGKLKASLVQIGVGTTLDSWGLPNKTTINGGRIETSTIHAASLIADQAMLDFLNARQIVAGSVHAENIITTNAKISLAQIEKLEVGTNIFMKAGSSIAWDISGETGVIPPTVNELGLGTRLTNINSSGIYTGSITAGQITAGIIDAARIRIGADTSYENGYATARTFITEPVPPYSVGDLWVGGSGEDIKRCINGRDSGSFVGSDWDAATTSINTVKDLADGKRRVFTSTPYPPYDIGDLWTAGSSGDLKRCKTAKLAATPIVNLLGDNGYIGESMTYGWHGALYVDGHNTSALKNGFYGLDCSFSDWDWPNNPRSNYIRIVSINTHKYLLLVKAYADPSYHYNIGIYHYNVNTGALIKAKEIADPAPWQTLMLTATSDGNDLLFRLTSGYPFVTNKGWLKDLVLIDLTAAGDASLSDAQLETKYGCYTWGNSGDPGIGYDPADWEVATVFSGWVFPGKTTINGGLIETNTILAQHIRTGELVVGNNVGAGFVGTYINSSGIYTGTIQASQITTTNLYAERLYKPGNSSNYAVIGGTYCDLKLYNANGCYFTIYDAIDGTGAFKDAQGNGFLSFGGNYVYCNGTWDFSNATNVIGVKAKFA